MLIKYQQLQRQFLPGATQVSKVATDFCRAMERTSLRSCAGPDSLLLVVSSQLQGTQSTPRRWDTATLQAVRPHRYILPHSTLAPWAAPLFRLSASRSTCRPSKACGAAPLLEF